jgi:heme exporter protein D
MNWSSFAEFVDMGGYALYVWGSYLMAGAALGWEALMLALRRSRAVQALAEVAQARRERPTPDHPATPRASPEHAA